MGGWGGVEWGDVGCAPTARLAARGPMAASAGAGAGGTARARRTAGEEGAIVQGRTNARAGACGHVGRVWRVGGWVGFGWVGRWECGRGCAGCEGGGRGSGHGRARGRAREAGAAAARCASRRSMTGLRRQMGPLLPVVPRELRVLRARRPQWMARWPRSARDCTQSTPRRRARATPPPRLRGAGRRRGRAQPWGQRSTTKLRLVPQRQMRPTATRLQPLAGRSSPAWRATPQAASKSTTTDVR